MRQRRAPCASSSEGQRRSPHLRGRPGGTPPLRSGGGWVGVPLQKTPSFALSLPCEIVSISQGRPLLVPEFTTSGQEEAGKGLKIPVCGGSSLHVTPFRQEAAVHWMPMGHGSAVPLFSSHPNDFRAPLLEQKAPRVSRTRGAPAVPPWLTGGSRPHKLLLRFPCPLCAITGEPVPSYCDSEGQLPGDLQRCLSSEAHTR
jgi:hypothetical protein